jgi:hypothetical protein
MIVIYYKTVHIYMLRKSHRKKENNMYYKKLNLK